MENQVLYDLIIIGGGPAGVTAGIYALRKKLRTLIISKDFQGQMKWAVSVENYPGMPDINGMDLAKKFEDHIKKYGAKIIDDEVIKIDKENQIFELITKKGDRFISLSVIIATGADPRPLEVPGEKEFISKGVTYCTTCDAPFFKDKPVAVIGGGNSGVKAAIELTNYASKVYLLEFQDKLAADELEQERARNNEKIEILTSSALKSIEGGNKVEKITYQDVKSKQKKNLNVEGVFVSVGTQPATSFIKEMVDFNEKDEIVIDPKTCQTKTPGLFSAGDVTDVKYNQIVIAAGEGAKAALSVYDYLRDLNK
ncbi:thioredoxin-disulfide reductase [Patescibacteria group bacterium]|nr:thioredoxin-disulfide reductase [Patescibacteria group bacterium]MBU4162143.1 thioredoxin-disulfide reductase [Patescibacteria group bacterium]